MPHAFSGLRLGPALALTLTLGAAACVPVKGLQTPGGAAVPGVSTGVTGLSRADAAAAAGQAPLAPGALAVAASLPPPLTFASPSAAPTPSPSPTASPTPLPEAPKGLTAAHQALMPVLQKKLLNIAKVGFNQAAASLISDKGGAVLANNSAGIIANNSGSIIGNNAGGYRVAQAADSIALEALDGEELTFDHIWPDSRRFRVFRPAGATSFDSYRQYFTNPAGVAVKEISRKVAEKHADGSHKVFDEGQVLQADDGRLLCRALYTCVNHEDGSLASVRIAPDSTRWKDDVGGIHLEVAELELDYVANAGRFRTAYPKLEQVEVGTLTNLRKDANGKVVLNLVEPFAFNDGESRQETLTGELLYTRKVATAAGDTVSTYDLQGGLTMRLTRTKGSLDELGELLVDGRAEAEVKQERRADGSRVFVVTFPEDRDHPLVIGYGVVNPQSLPTATPKPPVWQVSTAAGAEAGFADGAGAVARFKNLTAIAPSRVSANRFYLVDSGNHAIRTMDVAADGALTIATYAGTGTAGAANGARLEATFTGPHGLAVDADDTLYVSEVAGHRIRKIAPDGTVSTFAGSGAAAFKNAVGVAASFYQPAGLALAADQTLYVAEFGSQVIRKIAADATVSTLAGGMYAAGALDGTGTAARFNRPNALVVDAEGNLIVADRDNYSLRHVTPAGVVTTLAGTGGFTTIFRDGAGAEMAFGYPRGLCFDATGRLFVGSTNVRMRLEDGRFVSYAGLHPTGHKDASHDQANFSNIQALAFGPKGVLYVTDGTRIRAIVPPTPAP